MDMINIELSRTMDPDLQGLSDLIDRSIADRRDAEALFKEVRSVLTREREEGMKAKSELQLAQASVRARFKELGTMTKLLKEALDASATMLDQRTWLIDVHSLLEEQPGWWGLLPKSWRTARQHQRLRRSKLFDAGKYLELYPDVASAGMDPLRHFILHGMVEGRILPKMF